MTFRGTVGMNNRQDLFQKTPRSTRSEDQPRNNRNYDVINNANDELASEDERIHKEFGLGRPEQSPLQLDRVLGCVGDYRNTLVMSPVDENKYYRGLGCLVSFESLSDTMQQKCLRAHDMTVSALDVSSSGALIASGQVGTKNFKGYAAPVFIWHAHSYRRLQVLKGLTVQVNFVKFSPDERFVCAGGEDSVLYIWDIATTEVIFCQRHSGPVTVFTWLCTDQYSDSSYDIIYGLSNGLQKATLTYDPTRVLWNLKSSSFSMPPGSSATRTFLSLAVTPDSNNALVGTTSGEMLVFRVDTKVFRASIPICTGGLQSIVAQADGSVICGGGDGTVKRLQGYDLAWRIVGETVFDSAVKSLSLSPNQSEIVVACASGSIYRCLVSTFNKAIIQFNHTSTLTSISFNYDMSYPSSIFATGSSTGELRVWDMTDFACQAYTKMPKSGKVYCVKLVRNELLISGWEDGFIRCHDAGTLNRQVWMIANAHRGGVASVDVHIADDLQYIVSGGEDNAVRIWKFNTRELISQCNEHRKPIQRVQVDCSKPHIIHSIATDGTVLSYDLKVSRRVMYHMIPNGIMYDLSQRKDSENEIVTCDSYGRLIHWDIDYRDPVLTMQDPSGKTLRACSISPSGKYLVVGGEDELVKIYHIESNQIKAIGQGHSDSVLTAVWTPDERQVISTGVDGCLCVWNFYLADDVVRR